MWLRRSSTVRLALVLSAIFALSMAAAAFITIAVGSDVFERRIDTTLQALAGATDLENGRGDTFGGILRAPDDLSLSARPRWPLDQSQPAMLGSGKKGAKA